MTRLRAILASVLIFAGVIDLCAVMMGVLWYPAFAAGDIMLAALTLVLMLVCGATILFVGLSLWKSS